MQAEKLSISLPADMTKLIRDKVATGSYGSSSEVIREAMRPWFERERKLAMIDQAIDRGIAAAEAGDVRDLIDVRDELLARIDRKVAAKR